jgi:DNA-binding NarL/FixJ family response regulator
MKQVSERPRVLADRPTPPGSDDTGEDGEEGPHSGRSIVYIDALALTRDCVARELAGFLPEFRVAAIASPADLTKAASQAKRLGCAIYHTHALAIEDERVLHDLCLLRRLLGRGRIIILSDLDATHNVIGAMHHGAAGYVPASLSLKIAAEAIRLVLAGGTFIPASALANPAEPARRNGTLNGANGSTSIRLTLRQNQVVRAGTAAYAGSVHFKAPNATGVFSSKGEAECQANADSLLSHQ